MFSLRIPEIVSEKEEDTNLKRTETLKILPRYNFPIHFKHAPRKSRKSNTLSHIIRFISPCQSSGLLLSPSHDDKALWIQFRSAVCVLLAFIDFLSFTNVLYHITRWKMRLRLPCSKRQSQRIRIPPSSVNHSLLLLLLPLEQSVKSHVLSSKVIPQVREKWTTSKFKIPSRAFQFTYIRIFCPPLGLGQQMWTYSPTRLSFQNLGTFRYCAEYENFPPHLVSFVLMVHVRISFCWRKQWGIGGVMSCGC